MRVLACPRRPRKSRSCFERMPLTICGMTRVAVADDAGEQLLAGLELADHVAAELVLDGRRAVAGLLQLSERGGAGVTSCGGISGDVARDDRRTR